MPTNIAICEMIQQYVIALTVGLSAAHEWSLFPLFLENPCAKARPEQGAERIMLKRHESGQGVH